MAGFLNFLGPAGIALGAAGDIFGMVKGIGQMNAANQINPQFTQYTASPYAKYQLGTAQNIYNGRMAGADAEERNIANSQANFNNTVQRNATDGSQVLALAAAGQGQANNAYNQLGIQEQQNKYALLNNLNSAYAANINEGDKVYKSQLDKYKMDLERQAMLEGAGAKNVFGAFQGLGSLGIMGAGGFKNG